MLAGNQAMEAIDLFSYLDVEHNGCIVVMTAASGLLSSALPSVDAFGPFFSSIGAAVASCLLSAVSLPIVVEGVCKALFS